MNKLISFDIGNTLIELSHNGFCSNFSMKTGIKFEELRPLFYEYFLTKNEPIHTAVKKVCKIVGYKNPQNIIDEFRPKQIKIFKDVLPTLKYLDSIGTKMIAISNCTPWEANTLDELMLKPYVEKVFYSFDVGVAKPDSEIFHYVQKEFNLSTEEFIHIGDSYNADIIGAINAGWQAIFLNRNADTCLFRNEEGVLVINSLKTLPEALKILDIFSN